MALFARPAMVRKACLNAPSTLTLSSRLTFTSRAPASSLATRLPLAISRSQSLRFPESHRNVHSHGVFESQSRVAAFHASARRSILPAGPQKITGGVNEAAPVPSAEPTHGSYHWTFERSIALALIPLTIVPFAAGSLNPITDAMLCGTLIIHSHIGFQSVIIDYLPTWKVPKTRLFFWWGLRAATLTVAVGLYEFETNDVGLTEAIKRIWTA
ncbi:MAG: hypothetical protein M1812_003486 [Candelaria pacifica]|nr:MAG: hypothetical protein M1812_003486 [Candelaria pacifica]